MVGLFGVDLHATDRVLFGRFDVVDGVLSGLFDYVIGHDVDEPGGHEADQQHATEEIRQQELPAEQQPDDIPISMTRFVAANIYAPSAAAAEAPCLKKLFAVATALYEHDEDMKPKKVPYPNSSGLWPSSSFETVSVDTQASTPPAIAKPTTKAHQVIQAIVTAVLAVSIVPLTRYSPSGWLVATAPMTIASTAIPLRIA